MALIVTSGRTAGPSDLRTGLPLAWCALIGLALVLASVAAHLGRLASSEIVGRVPVLAGFGPGAIGRLRGLPLDNKGLPPVGSGKLAAAGLAAAPLSYEPFFIAASDGFQGTRKFGSDRDVILLGEALRRNQRSREGRSLMLIRALGTNDLTGAIDQIAVLGRLNNAMIDTLMPAVGKAISSEKQADEVNGALARHPELYSDFLRGFASTARPSPVTLRLISTMPPSVRALPDVRTLATDELVRIGAYDQARRLWGLSASPALVNSADFSDRTTPPPFNWSLASGTEGVAERQGDGGILVDFYGRDPKPLVSQLITLPPGRYTAEILYRTQAGTPGALALQLTCATTRRRFVDQPLRAPAEVTQRLRVDFTVPADNCAGQLLAIGGRLDLVAKPQAILLRKLDIVRGDGR